MPLDVSGFTFVRNAVRLGFPVVECIRSVLPMVGEFVVAVGESDDGTEALIRGIRDPKLFVVPSRWSPRMRSGGYVLAQQTNIALMNCTGEWAVYIQADEAIHEDHHAYLLGLMAKYRADHRVESLALHRLDFYGDYRTLYVPADNLRVRIVKPHRFVLSRGDAAGFTVHPKYKERGRRITTIDTGAPLFHYLDLRTAEERRARRQAVLDYWHGEAGPIAPPASEADCHGGGGWRGGSSGASRARIRRRCANGPSGTASCSTMIRRACGPA